ncbi:MAG: gamma-glutamylcyclotransferase family protein [Verrucomicrobiota bacterium]
MMKEKESGHSVFVYGTLKPGGFYWPRFCEGKVSDVQPAKIRGSLYDLHVGYPGLVLGGENWVEGYVLTFPQEKDFLQLDFLEDYSPDRPATENEYNRLKVNCIGENGEVFGDVWVYEMSEATVQRFAGTLIMTGNWPVKSYSLSRKAG